MNKEIKEILDKLKNHIEGIRYANLTKYELRILLDYITNLEQENEIRQQDINNLTYQLAKEKTRIDKAIKHIKEYCIDDEFYINLTNKEKNIIDVLNILQGGE